jgi:hypothetical protein
MQTLTFPRIYPHVLVRAHTQKYVILIAFVRPKVFCELASVLHYTYIAYFVVFVGVVISIIFWQ